MVVLGGPNLVGKTTVGMELRRRWGRFSYRHTTKPMVSALNYRLWQLADAHPFMIVDRCHWSDWAFAYGAGFGGVVTPLQTGWPNPSDWRLIELAFMSRGAHVLLMVDSAEGILEGSSRPESRLPCQLWNLPETQQEAWMDEFCHFAYRVACRHALVMPPSLGIGSPDAEFVVIADDWADGPPVGVVEKSAGGSCPDLPLSRGWEDWWTAVDLSGLEWWKGYYTLAGAFQNDPRQFADYRARCMPNVETFVCLGPNAARMVLAATGSPSFWGHDIFVLEECEEGPDRREGLTNIVFHALSRWRPSATDPEPAPIARLWVEGSGSD